MKKLLFIFVMSSALFSHAKILTFNTVNFSNQLIGEEAGFNNDLNRTAEHIDSWRLAPVNIHAIIVPSGDNASFDFGSNIYIPRSVQFTNQWGAVIGEKTTVDVVRVFSHEYGHAVFDDYLNRVLPQYRVLKKIKTEISELDLKRIQSPLSDDQRKEIAAAMKAKEDSVNSNKELIRTAKLTLPYAELFADVVAVYDHNSKSAISEALWTPEANKFRNPMGYLLIASRDFGQFHDPETWDQNEGHILFAPVRSVIGADEFWPATDEDRAKKLKCLAVILLDDIIEKNKAGVFATPADNKPVIEKFKSRCK